jgi:lipopolysaccharide export system protein LptA
MKRHFVLFICIFWGFCSALWAQEIRKDIPTKITSDKMVYQSKGNKVIFESNVHVLRDDFELWSDKLYVFFKEKGAAHGSSTAHEGKKKSANATGLVSAKEQEQLQPGAGDIDKIIAEGNVRFLRDGKRGECARITFDPETKEIRMEGNPKVMEGKNEICGEVIILNLKNNTSEVIGNSKQRVQAIFFTSPGLQGDGEMGR